MNRQLNDYEIIRAVGDGHSGQVRLAKDKTSGESVALKTVSGDNQERVSLEKANAEAVMKLSNRNIVRVFGYFFEAADLHVVMHYCSDRNLRNVLDAKEVEEALVVRWAEELASAAVYLEHNGVIHNDIKPENLMVTAERSIVLVDFSEAQLVGRQDQPTRTGGTGIYEAPERKNGGPASFASDMWSLGIVIYEINYLEQLPLESIEELVEQQEILSFRPSSLSDLLEPILEEILVVDARTRMDAKKLHRILKDYIERKIFPPRKPRIGEAHRIKDSFPKPQSKQFINIVPPQDLDRLFFPPPADKKLEKRVVLLAGLAGSGKSTAAVQYGLHFASQPSDSVVVLFHADDEAKIDERVRAMLVDDLAVDKELVSAMSREERIARIREHVKNSGRRHLFVFDNVGSEQVAVVELFVRWQPRDLRILLTSRDHSIRLDGLELVRMPFLSAAQVKAITVERLASLLSNPCVQRIYERFMSLAELTEDEAARERSRVTPYMLKSFMDAILARLDGSNTQELTLAGLERVLEGIDVKKTVEIVLESIAKYPGCEKLLGTIAFLDPDAMSSRCLRLLSDADCQESRETLERFAVLEAYFSQDVRYVKLHRSTRNLIKRRLRDSDRAASESEAARLTRRLTSVLSDTSVGEKEHLINFKHVFVHVLKFTRRNINNDDKFQLVKQFLLVSTLYRGGEKLMPLELTTRALGYVQSKHEHEPNHPEVGEFMAALGARYKLVGDYREAKHWLLKAYDVYAKCYCAEPDHPEIADTLLAIGQVELLRQKPKKATKYMLRAIDLMRSRGSASLSLAASTLGMCYMETGDLNNAVRYLREAFDTRKPSSNGADMSLFEAVESVEILNNLGLVYFQMSNYNESKNCLLRAFELSKLGADLEPMRQLREKVRLNLGQVLSQIGDHESSTRYATEAFEQMESSHKDVPNHPEMAIALNNLGMISAASGDNVQAAKHFARAIEICETAFKDQPDNVTHAMCLSNAASGYSEIGQHEKAIECALAGLNKCRSIYKRDPGYANLARALNTTGMTFQEAGDHESAVEYLLEAYELFKGATMKDRRLQRQTASNSARDLWRQVGQKFENNNADVGDSRAAGDDHSDENLVSVLRSLAESYLSLGDSESAIQRLTEAEQICRHVSPEDEPSRPTRRDQLLARVLFDLACALVTADDKAKAAKCYEEAYKLRKTVSKDDAGYFDDDADELCSLCLFNAGKCYYDLKKFERALELILATFKIRLAENDQSGLVECRWYLGEIYSTLNQPQKAIEYLLPLSKALLDQPTSDTHFCIFALLGKAFFNVSNYERATHWKLEAIRVAEFLWPGKQSHQAIKTLYKELAEAYHAWGDAENAQKYSRMASEMDSQQN